MGAIQHAVMQAVPADIKKMKLTPPSIDVLTENGRFCNDKGEINFEVRSTIRHPPFANISELCLAYGRANGLLCHVLRWAARCPLPLDAALEGC